MQIVDVRQRRPGLSMTVSVAGARPVQIVVVAVRTHSRPTLPLLQQIKVENHWQGVHWMDGGNIRLLERLHPVIQVALQLHRQHQMLQLLTGVGLLVPT